METQDAYHWLDIVTNTVTEDLYIVLKYIQYLSQNCHSLLQAPLCILKLQEGKMRLHLLISTNGHTILT